MADAGPDSVEAEPQVRTVGPEVRTVVVRSPSIGREAGMVLRILAHIAFWSIALLGASHERAVRAGGGTAAASIPVDAVAFRDLPDDDQRMFRHALEGLTEAQDDRSRTRAWPEVDALAGRGIPPFARDPLDRAGYRWRKLQATTLVNYLGVPADPKRPVILILALEPDPGTPDDPNAVVDETHHRLGDGTWLHVGIYVGAKKLDAPVAMPAFEDGWRRVTATP